MKLSLWLYGIFIFILGQIYGEKSYSKEDIFWKKFVLKYVFCLKYF